MGVFLDSNALPSALLSWGLCADLFESALTGLELLTSEKLLAEVRRIFPNTESCLRLIRALCVETHETWLEDNRYLSMTLLAEQKKKLLRLAA